MSKDALDIGAAICGGLSGGRKLKYSCFVTGINIREYICCYFIPMGNCAGKPGPPRTRKPEITHHESKCTYF